MRSNVVEIILAAKDLASKVVQGTMEGIRTGAARAAAGVEAMGRGAREGISAVGAAASGVRQGVAAVAATVHQGQAAISGMASSTGAAAAEIRQAASSMAAAASGSSNVATSLAQAGREAETCARGAGRAAAGIHDVSSRGQAVIGVFGGLRAATDASDAAMRRFETGSNGAVQALAGVAAGAGAMMLVRKTISDGIEDIDEYKRATIGIAANLTDMAAKGSKDLKEIYQANKAYALETYERVELASAKFFASGKEMTEAWQILTNKGVLLTSEQDIDNLGTIVDKVKLMTQGQVASLQIAQELRSIMNGQARATDQLGMLLSDRVGPEWEKQLLKAREEGRVLEWLASQFQGMAAASEDVTSTLESQRSTLATLTSQIGRRGLAQTYDDIAALVSKINDHLRVHKEDLVSGIGVAWIKVKDTVETIRASIEEINDFSEKHPILAGATGELLEITGKLALLAVAGRAAIGGIGWMAGAVVGTFVFWKTILGGISTTLAGITWQIVAQQGALGALGAAAGVVGSFILGWKLGEIIAQWEIAGIKVGEYVEMAYSGLSMLFAHAKCGAREAWIFVQTAAVGAIGAIESAFWAMLSSMQSIPVIGDVLKALFGDTEQRFQAAQAGIDQAYQELAARSEANRKALEDEIRLNEEVIRLTVKAADARKKLLPSTGASGGAAATHPSTGASGGAAAPHPATEPAKPYDPDAEKAAKRKQEEAEKAAEEHRRNVIEAYQAEMELSEAISRRSLARIQSEQNALQQEYELGKVGIVDYYEQLKIKARESSEERLAALEKEKELRNSIREAEMAGAKTPEEKRAVSLKYEADVQDMDAEIDDHRAKLRESLAAIQTELDKALRERRKAQEDVLRDILASENMSLEERRELNARYTALRIEQIRQEADEYRKKGVDKVLVDRWVAEQSRDIQGDLRALSLEQLRGMLADEKTTAEKRRQIWQEIDQRIENDQVGLWEAFRFGASSALDDFRSKTRAMYEAGRELIGGLSSGFRDLLGKFFKGELNKASDAWNAFCDILSNTFSNMLSKMVEAWLSQAIGGMFSSLFGSVLGGYGQSVKSSGSVVQTRYGKGGVVRSPTLAWVGEEGDAEAVVPLPDGRSIPVSGDFGIKRLMVFMEAVMAGIGAAVDDLVNLPRRLEINVPQAMHDSMAYARQASRVTAAAAGSIVSSQGPLAMPWQAAGGEVTVEMHNHGSEKKAEAKYRMDGLERMVVSIILDDLDRGGPVDRAIRLRKDERG